MNAIHVKCPSCGARLVVPAGNVKRFIRCGRCRHKFPVAAQAEAVMENVVASWLTDQEEPPPAGQGLANEAGTGEESLLLHPEDLPAPPEAASGKPGEIRVVKVERRGALFEFPVSRLLEPEFRTAFPRQCMSCDARTHLRAHMVVFSAQLQDSVSVEAEHQAGALMLSDQEVRGLSGQELLDRLHEVPNVPYPGNLPMPYWVCDMCSGSGTVSGQIQVNRNTGKGWCRLFIRNLRRAMEFMVNAGGEGAEGHNELRKRLEQTAENPWDVLPEVVQHRVQQWFQPQSGEQFIAYVPDRDHVRTEDGMAGVLISGSRLIYHTPRSHYECRVDELLELKYASGGGKRRISMKAPGWEIHHMTVDRDGITRMRRGLSLGKFQAVWR